MSTKVTLRIFRTREEVERAQKVLEKGGFRSDISEDKFGTLTLNELNIPPRFRLLVSNEDYFTIAEYLRDLLPKRVK